MTGAFSRHLGASASAPELFHDELGSRSRMTSAATHRVASDFLFDSAVSPFGSTATTTTCFRTPQPRPGTSSGNGSMNMQSPSRGASAGGGSRPGSTHRLSPDELNCFRRVKVPSSHYEAKTEQYFQTTGQLRQTLADQSWNSLPVLKGKFYAVSGMSEAAATAQRKDSKKLLASEGGYEEYRLPDEELTGAILDQIFPRIPPHQQQQQLLDQKKERCTSFMEEDLVSVEVCGSADSAVGSGGGSPSATPMAMAGTTTSAMDSGLSAKKKAAQQRLARNSLPGSRSSMVSADALALKPSQGGRSSTMLDFRMRLLQKFSSINEACECLSRDAPPGRPMVKNEFRRVLRKQGFEWSNKDKDTIFAELDFQQAGSITMSDVHIAVEAAAPVRSIEDLRRRWLASGYSSMISAVRKAETSSDVELDDRLPYPEFCKVMKSVNVLDGGEHQAIFSAICGERGPTPRVSLEELLAAIAMVSPDLLLEDLRARLLKFYGSIDKAWNELDKDRGGSIEAKEFAEKVVWRMGFAMHEAKKVFRHIDLDGNGDISREEYLTALRTSEPSLSLEDLRLKIRRSFRSILEALRLDLEASNPMSTGEFSPDDIVSPMRFASCLAPLDFKESEARTLYDLIDIRKEGDMSLLELVKGLHYFAPACAMEDLRVRCIQRASHVQDAFSSLSLSEKSLLRGMEEFCEELYRLKLIHHNELDRMRCRKTSSVSVDGTSTHVLFSGDVILTKVFDLLDVSNVGQVSISRVVAALQSCGAGSRVRLAPRERDEHARTEMKDQLWPKHRLVAELKHQVRLGAEEALNSDSDSAPDYLRSQPLKGRAHTSPPGNRGRAPSDRDRLGGKTPHHSTLAARHLDKLPNSTFGNGSVGNSGMITATASAPATAVKSTPKLRTTPLVDLVDYMDSSLYNSMRLLGPDPSKPSQMVVQGAQESFCNMWDSLQNCEPSDEANRGQLENGLHSYFESAALSMSHDVPLLAGVARSSMDQYKKMRAHKAVLRM